MDKRGYNYLIEQKTLWEKEKLLVTSNYFFSHNVFKNCVVDEYRWSEGLMKIHVAPHLSFPNDKR